MSDLVVEETYQAESASPKYEALTHAILLTIQNNSKEKYGCSQHAQ